MPEGAAYDRDDLIRYILDSQVPGGGWTLYGSQADVDMTAMAVYALAPYYTGMRKSGQPWTQGWHF